MSSTRDLVVSLGFGIGFWVLASFAGAMLDPTHAEPWTTSLMWSLLASAVIAPALLMAYHNARRKSTRRQSADRRKISSQGKATGEAKPFIETAPSAAETLAAEEASAGSRQATLWPEPQSRETGPGSEEAGEWPYIRDDRGQTVAA